MSFYDRNCGNGVEGGERCTRPAWRGVFNPLGLCLECLTAYRASLPTSTPIGEDLVFVAEPGERSVVVLGGSTGRVARGLYFDRALGRKVPCDPPPGGVPVLGRDFWAGPG